MLTRSTPRPQSARARPARRRSHQRARRGAAAALAVTLAVALPALAGAAPARADIVRQDQTWVLDAVDAPAAWQISEGQGVTVAVIDSGVSAAASDLTSSVLPGPDYTGVGTPPSDPNWGMHGTWMASLIAGHGHGGTPGTSQPSGILGTAPKARVLSIRVITDRQDPGYTAYQNESPRRGQRELAAAIRYAVAHHAGVISMSLGYDMASRPVRTALQYAVSNNVVVVASAGNSGELAQTRRDGHAPYSFPASYPGVLSVGAVNRYGQPASFSSGNISVEVVAPGVKVPAEGRGNQYWLVSGTSPACALTAGIAALIRSRFPALSPALVRMAIMTSTQSRPPAGYDAEVGFGTVDAAAALQKAAELDRHDVTAVTRTGGSAGGPASARSVAVTQHFGGGPGAVPPVPVGPRGIGPLLLLLLLGAGCLAIVALAAWRLVTVRRAPAGGPPGWASSAGHGPGGHRPGGHGPGPADPSAPAPGAPGSGEPGPARPGPARIVPAGTAPAGTAPAGTAPATSGRSAGHASRGRRQRRPAGMRHRVTSRTTPANEPGLPFRPPSSHRRRPGPGRAG